jgi:hypothetical protein
MINTSKELPKVVNILLFPNEYLTGFKVYYT